MTPPTERPDAILLLAYGGPDSLDDIPAYLLDIRGGRETPQHLIDEITGRYDQIGGYSPLLQITTSAAEKLSRAIDLPVYVGMRHWAPYIPDVVAEMAAQGVQRARAICMAPHYSRMSIGAYRRHLDEALAALDEPFAVEFIPSWHTLEPFLAAIAANVRQTLARFPADVRDGVHVVFSAHSLPQMIVEQGDPYDAQLRETADLLAERLGLPEGGWSFVYQSAAQTGVPWLGPQIEDYVPELAARGVTNALIAPIGFIADHVEVLYDLDIGVRQIAEACGIHVERTPMLNDTEALVATLTELATGPFSPQDA